MEGFGAGKLDVTYGWRDSGYEEKKSFEEALDS
jgi:hypothetical protein